MPVDDHKLSKAFIIAKDIEEKIVSGIYEVGSSIPSQNELSRIYGISSRSVREAFKLLETRGLIVTQQGKPATVIRGSSKKLINSLSMTVINETNEDPIKIYHDLMQVLTTFSTNSVRTICKSKPNIDKLKKLVDQLDGISTEEIFIVEVQIIKTIMSLTDNAILASIFTSLEGVMVNCLSKVNLTQEQIEKRHKGYAMLVQAIEMESQDIGVALILMLLNTLKQEADKVYSEDDDQDIKINFA